MPRTRAWMFLALAAAAAAWTRDASACRVIDLDFTPSADLQLVIWLEDSEGRYLDTLFITEATGRYGLGNRPGIMEFNSEFLWPYGRRETLFPVWAHKRGVTYPRVVFQDGFDRDLSHAFTRSSPESYYCRPMRQDEPVLQRSIDSGSCATVAFTDKGKLSPDIRSSYPPRRDVVYEDGTDSTDVLMYAQLNDLDAVSRATPPGGVAYTYSVAIPSALPDGQYVVWVEVGKERDQNASYHYPSPALQAYGDYGLAYRGQPSVLWKLPFTLDSVQRTTLATDYEGYGDPDGIDGQIRTPDPSITTTVEGSGAQRLLLVSGDGGMYRVRLQTAPSPDSLPPDPPATMSVVDSDANNAEVSFVEPADPNSGGPVKSFEVRIGVGQPLTAENFSTVGKIVPQTIVPAGPGTLQTVHLGDLSPETHYWIGVVAQDDCLNGSRPSIVELVTPVLQAKEVSACFVATAAWGSPMEAHVSTLRRFRDRMLRQVAVGEILVESYYTFGPALAAVIRPSDTLRSVTRTGLAPLVDWVHGVAP
jgi:hypothetical protein